MAESSQREDAIGIYDQIIDRLAHSAAPEMRRLVALALFDKGRALLQLERAEEAAAAFGWLTLGSDPAHERLVVVNGRAIPNVGPVAGPLPDSVDSYHPRQ